MLSTFSSGAERRGRPVSATTCEGVRRARAFDTAFETVGRVGGGDEEIIRGRRSVWMGELVPLRTENVELPLVIVIAASGSSSGAVVSDRRPDVIVGIRRKSRESGIAPNQRIEHRSLGDFFEFRPKLTNEGRQRVGSRWDRKHGVLVAEPSIRRAKKQRTDRVFTTAVVEFAEVRVPGPALWQ